MTVPPNELEGAVATAVAEGLAYLETLTESIGAAYTAAGDEVTAAVSEHAERPGAEALAAFRAEIARLEGQAVDRLGRQQQRLSTFNLVLFGRTGAGKSSLIEALSGGTGVSISRGESDWTTDVREVRWGACRLFDTPGIAGWGRTVDRAELEARAEAAVADADVVVLCFDTQSQQEGEFTKVAEWIARYGKPVVAVLNSRNGRWRFPPRVARPSSRRQLSRSVQEHAANIRDELALIGLSDVPVVAIHTKRAAFATTADPYEGPENDGPSRAKLRAEVGPEKLLAWSNLPALERLLAAALRDHAEALRLGMLREQARGMLTTDLEIVATSGGQAARAAEQIERGIEDVMGLLGRPSAAHLAAAIDELEALRGGGFSESAQGEAEKHVRARLAAALRKPRTDAIRRAERFVEQAFTERRDAGSEEFEELVAKPAAADAEAVAATVGRDLRDYLAQRLQLIATDVTADVDATLEQFGTARGSAGRFGRQLGIGADVSSGLVGVGSGIYMAVAALNGWNPLGWAMIGGITVAGIGSKLLGGTLRKQAAAKRERALSNARADARRAVVEMFGALETQIVDAHLQAFADAADERLSDEVTRAAALRRIARSADRVGTGLARVLEAIPASQDSDHILAETASGIQREVWPGEPVAGRLLWLGEAWCDDPEGLDPDEPESGPGRTTAYDPRRGQRLLSRMRAFVDRVGDRPRPGSGTGWLEGARLTLADDVEAMAELDAIAEWAETGRPQIVIAGDYSAGKSSFVKRLLVDAGEPTPDDLDVGARPVTGSAAVYGWGDWDLIDTPGFQSRHDEHTDAAHAAIVRAAVVVLLFNPNLVVGDTSDLSAVLLGDSASARPGKADRTLFVINRSDELGVDPHDDLAAYELLCDRKELELRQAIARITGASVDVREEQVVCAASDPYGMVGDKKHIGSAAYDEHRDWDGLEAFHDVLRRVSGNAMRNGVDIGVLESGATHLGQLGLRRRNELAVSERQAAQQERLLLDLDAGRETARAIRESARDSLVTRMVEMVARMYDDVTLTTDGSTRLARIDRLERWSEDPEVEQHVREWSTRVEAELEAWQASTAERVERRLGAASFRQAFPEIEDAANVEHLKPPGGDSAAAAGKAAAQGGADAAANASRETVTKIAHSLGRKFEPWGATKLTSKINVAGGALGVALGAWDLYGTWKSVRKEGADESAERQVRSRVLSEVRAATEAFFDGTGPDAPGATIDGMVDLVSTVRDDVASRLATRRDAERLLRTRLELCDTEINNALGAL